MPPSSTTYSARSRTLEFALAAGLLVVIYALCSGALDVGRQWDFRSYFFAARAYFEGLNPYSNHDVNNLNTTPTSIGTELTYPYHPYTLYLFYPLTYLPYELARTVYLGATLLAIVALVGLWKSTVIEYHRIGLPIFLVVLTFSYEPALRSILFSGNIAPFEALVIWLGFVALLRRRPVAFTIALSSVAFVKILPALFLPLVFLQPISRHQAILIGAVLASFAFAFALPYLTNSSQFLDYLHYIASIKDEAWANYSSLHFFTVLASLSGMKSIYATIAYLLLGGGALIYCVKRCTRSAWNENPHQVLFYVLATFAIIVPRLRPYTFLQMVPLCYWISLRSPIHLAIRTLAFPLQAFLAPALIGTPFLFVVVLIDWVFVTVFPTRFGKARVVFGGKTTAH